MTHSAFLVDLVTAVRRLGALLGPWVGVVADRIDRCQLALLAILMMSTVVATITLLVAIRSLEVWHLFTRQWYCLGLLPTNPGELAGRYFAARRACQGHCHE